MERIAVLDFGSQLTQLVARRVREAGVYSEVFSFDVDRATLLAFAPRGLILSGSNHSTLDDNSPRAPQWIWELGLPILGLCYGMQMMAVQLGGATQRCARREFGHAKISVYGNSALYDSVPRETGVWMSHGDQVSAMPKGFVCLASSDACPIASMADESRALYGIQFHPETTPTEYGFQMLKNFVLKVCGCSADSWSTKSIAELLVAEARETVAKLGEGGDVILGLSGGVDSSVVAAILHRAIGSRLKCVMIDNGLLRSNEAANVLKAFSEVRQVNTDGSESVEPLNIQVVDASASFFNSLAGVTDPEEKRKIIGREFMTAFEETSKQYSNVKLLAQGTIYPDVIESAHVGNASLIKTHHNVGGLPDNMRFKLVEPLRKLFKDEVRRVGETLGLAHAFLWRHPFPGPGLGVRILGEVTAKRARKLQAADAIFMEEITQSGLYSSISQALSALIPCKAVAVKGDGREYEEMITLRAVHTDDFMTATVVDIPTELLKTVSRRICNEVAGVSRVLYDYTEKPPATIEYE